MSDLGRWQPLSVGDVARLFADAPFVWWIAGGYAIEAACGRPLRPHDDIDVLILRRDHLTARIWLADWDCHCADPPGQLRRWAHGETLPPNVHDIWCRRDARSPWQFQLMLDESDGALWRSRRDARICRLIADLGHLDANGVPFLSPEIQLFYKAKAARPKDELDFAAVLPVLEPEQILWLRDAIVTTYGNTACWLPAVELACGLSAPSDPGHIAAPST